MTATDAAAPQSWFKRYKRLIISLIGVSLVPLLYAGALIWVNHDPTGHLDKVSAAVVNLDSPAKTSAGDRIDLGPDIVDQVKDSKSKSNLDWKQMSKAKAAKALRDGDVQAVMTIPKGFSAAAASAGDDDPQKAHATKIEIRTNDASNYLMGTISRTVGQEITNSVRDKVTDTYLKNIYVGFTDIHSNIADAANGSEKLSKNTSKAHKSTGDLVVGLDKLADGSVQLDSGAGQLATAAGKLDSGAGTLSDGLNTLDKKTSDLPASSKKLADGAGQLDKGLSTLSSAATGLNTGAGKLHDATGTLSDSTSAMPAATSKLADGAAKVASGNDQLASKAQAVDTQVTSITTSIDQTLDAVGDLLNETAGISNSTTIDVAGQAKQAKASADALLASDDMKAFLAQHPDLRQRLQTLQQNTSNVSDGATKIDAAVKRAEKAAGIVKNDRGVSVDQLKAASAKARSTAHQLKDSTAALADGADQVASGTAQLAKKAPTLASGAKRIDQATGQLADGTSQLKQNMPKLTAGSSALAKGTAQLSDSAPALANAVGQLASGADTLHSGTGQLTTATAKLAGATGDLVDGTQSADTGSKKLQDGLGQLADGADQLNDGLEDGVDQIPNYTGKDQDHLAKVNATPVSTDLAQHNSMGNYGTGLSPYFMSLALWIGGIGFFMLMAPLTERLLASRLPSILVALRSAWAPAIMAVVQAALVMTVVHLVIGIEMAHPMAVWLLAMFTSLTFLMVNQGLIAILGAPGRFLSLVMVVVQVASAGGTYPVQTMPHFLQGLRTIMPMSYTTQAFRSLIAGGPANGVGACVLALSIWLVFGLLLLVTATVLARRSDTVRDWATLAPGRPNGGRSVAPAVAVTPSAAMPDDAEQDRELVAVGAATGAATAGDGEAASGRHAAAAASATGPGDEPVAPISTLSNELLEEPSGDADPSPEAEAGTAPEPEASDTTQELPEASEPQEHNETEEKKEND